MYVDPFLGVLGYSLTAIPVELAARCVCYNKLCQYIGIKIY